MSPTPKSSHQKRGAIRFKPDVGAYAQIQIGEGGRATEAFRPTIVALITEESSKGCGLVLLTTEELQVGDRCRIQVGRLPVLSAEVRWRAQVDPSVVRMGLMYLE